MKKIFIATILTLFLFSPVLADDENDFLFDEPDSRQDQQDELMFNPPENSWHYESPDSELQYNPMEKRFEYVEPGEELKFNPMENEWEYAK